MSVVNNILWPYHIIYNHILWPPSTQIRIFLKTKTFFSVLAFHPRVNDVFGHRKRSRVSENGPQSGDFLKRRPIVFMRTNARKRRFFNKMKPFIMQRTPCKSL